MQASNFLDPEDHKKNILVLPSWYPSKLDVFAGDFVKRHVEAISKFYPQHVIFIVKDEHGAVTKNVLETKSEFENYTEVIIYYHIRKTGIRIIDRLQSDKRYLQLYKKYLKKHIREKGIPSLCHVHIAMKAGLAARWLKTKYNLPYLVTEHWSGYLNEAAPRLTDHGMIFQKRTRNILTGAEVVTAVSAYLATGIEKLFAGVKTAHIPNVVDTRIFYPVERNTGKRTRFIHASTMNYAKNIEKIFQALQIIKSRNYEFSLELFGPIQPGISEMIQDLSLQDHVFLKGDVSQEVLAGEMQKADAMIQFSRFETFSCVVVEANATGLPVFISDIPALRELITDNKNGYVVRADDSAALARKLMDFIDGKLLLDTDIIPADTHRFSYLAVGKMFSEIYSDIINPA